MVQINVDAVQAWNARINACHGHLRQVVVRRLHLVFAIALLLDGEACCVDAARSILELVNSVFSFARGVLVLEQSLLFFFESQNLPVEHLGVVTDGARLFQRLFQVYLT